MSNEYIYAGDIIPDGRITAYEMSLIINNLGKKDNHSTDINANKITDTQDYFISLYSLKENIADEKIELLPKPTSTPTKCTNSNSNFNANNSSIAKSNSDNNQYSNFDSDLNTNPNTFKHTNPNTNYIFKSNLNT